MIEKDLCQYFKERNFETFMDAWRLQFEKLGVVGGVVSVKLTDENREDISNFLGLHLKNQKHVKVSWRKLKSILSNSKFEGADFKRVLELYFNDVLLTKKSKKELNEDKTQRFFNDLLDLNLSDLSRHWIEDILQTKNGVYISIVKEKNKGAYRPQFIKIIKALGALPFLKNTHQSLAVFAAEITGDPHAFDTGTYLNYLLIQGIAYTLDILDAPETARSNTQTLLKAGLLKEDINNFCSIYGFSAIKDKVPHPAWEGFYTLKESWNANLNNILNVDSIDLKDTAALYIIENPSIFEALIKVAQKDNLPLGFVCSNGQPTQAVYAMLDKLQNAQTKMYYAGDFDPEGLLMAQRLLNTYPNLDLWLYEEDHFFQQVSNKKASDKRIKMHENLEDERLINISELIEEVGIGYQENMLKVYVEDIKRK